MQFKKCPYLMVFHHSSISTNHIIGSVWKYAAFHGGGVPDPSHGTEPLGCDWGTGLRFVSLD
jgi:hypothetical protein